MLAEYVRLRPVKPGQPAPYSPLRIGLLVFAVVWQAAWMLADDSLWPTVQSNLWESMLIVGSWLTWLTVAAGLIMLRQGFRSETLITHAVRLNIVLLVLAATIMSLFSIDPTVNDWITSASIFNLVLGIAGISIRNPEQWFWVSAIFVIELLIFIFFGLRYPEELITESVILYPLYALAIGVAAASAQRGLLHADARSESARLLAIEKALQAESALEQSRSIARTQARIHESVLNTLTAIGRGGLPNNREMNEAISHRSSESAEVLRSLSQSKSVKDAEEPPGFMEWLGDLIVECSARGIDVTVTGDSDAIPPSLGEEAIMAAIRETFTNAIRHANAQRISLDFKASGRESYRVTISDDGQGIPDQHIFASLSERDDSPGYGIPVILGRDLRAVGARAVITSHQGSGTRVSIEYSHSHHLLRRLTKRSPIPTSVVVAPVLLTWLLFSAVNIALVIGSYQEPWLNLIAFALILLFSLGAIALSRSGDLPWWLIFIGIAVAAFTYSLENHAGQDVTASPWSEWSSEAIVAMFFVLSAASTWWAWIFVGIAWLVIQGGFPGELFAPGFVLIMAGGFLGFVLRRLDTTRQRSLESVARDSMSASVSRLQMYGRSDRFSQCDLDGIADFLDGVASGEQDWKSASVQHECAVLEAYLRNVVMNEHMVPNSLLFEISELARSQHAVISVVGRNYPVDTDLKNVALEVVQMCVSSMTSTDRGRFSLTNESNNLVLRLVVTSAQDPQAWVSRSAGDGRVDIEQIDTGLYTLIWQHESAARQPVVVGDRDTSTNLASRGGESVAHRSG